MTGVDVQGISGTVGENVRPSPPLINRVFTLFTTYSWICWQQILLKIVSF